MNTLSIEKELSKQYHYKPLSKELSNKYRNFFKENIPSFLKIEGDNKPLYTLKGSKICNGYKRIVIGDYGAFIEFTDEQGEIENFIVAPGQEYRLNQERYRNIKYLWYTIFDFSNIKIYYQKNSVPYADYKPGYFYISVHEVKIKE